MGKLNVKRKFNKTIICYKLGKCEQINLIEMDIIQKEEIPALVKMEVLSAFTRKKISFSFSNLMDLHSYLKSGIIFSDFIDVVKQIIKTIRDCQSHGIRTSNLEMDINHIYVDTSRREKMIKMIYWPLLSLDHYANEMKLFQAIGEGYECAQADKIYCRQYLGYFNERAIFDVSWFETKVDEILKEWQTEYRESEASDRPRLNYSPKPAMNYWKMQGESEATMAIPRLFRVETAEDIPIKRFPFSVGRTAELCDCAISNRSISGLHMTLFYRNGRYYIKDEKSYNGTIVEDVPLAPGEEKELISGNRLELGSEEFVFYAGDNRVKIRL